MPLNIAKTLLLEVDVQNDFCPTGALPVANGVAVIEPLNRLADAIISLGGWVAASQDWHPKGHISFRELWPEHCVQGTEGAAFHRDLDQKPISLVIRKGFRKELDSYSVFFENDRTTSTGLEGWIRKLGIETIVMGGLATDYCVFYSAIDGVNLGFNIIIADDAVCGVGQPAGSIESSIMKMRTAGVRFLASWEILEDFK